MYLCGKRERKSAAELAETVSAERKVLKAALYSGGRQFLRASFYHSAKIRLSAHFAPAGNLLESAFPKPCFCGLRRLSTERRSYHAKEIQHAPPQPGSQDPAFRGRIRRLYRAACPLWYQPVRVSPAGDPAGSYPPCPLSMTSFLPLWGG